MVLELCPPIMTVIVMLVKYMNGVLHVEKLKEMCNMIKSDTERLMDLPEYKILHMHAMEGRKFLLSVIGAVGIIGSVYVILPTTLIVNDIMTKNKSEEKYLMYKYNYLFFDVQDYYYLMTAQCYVASMLVPLILCSLDSMYITFTQHACAMFAVAGYRLKTVHILNVDALRREFNHTKYNKLLVDEQERIYEKLVLCVKEHKRALQCTQLVQSAYSVALFIQIMMNIVLLSISGVQSLLKLTEERYTEMMRLVIWMVGDHIHLYFLYLPGQKLFDFSTQVYYDALECMWYKCSMKSRVIYQIMVMNTLTPFKLTALKITRLNMEAFLAVTRAAVSYFTVLSSTV